MIPLFSGTDDEVKQQWFDVITGVFLLGYCFSSLYPPISPRFKRMHFVLKRRLVLISSLFGKLQRIWGSKRMVNVRKMTAKSKTTPSPRGAMRHHSTFTQLLALA